MSDVNRMALVLLLLSLGAAINQSCPCPANSQCLQTNNMCGCDTGFIGNCSTPALVLGTTEIQVSLVQGNNVLISVDPISVGQYLQFTFNLCLTTPLTLTLNLYGQTGTTTQYNSNNQLGNTITSNFHSGCQQITTPYISFGYQPNGQYDLLIIGILNSQPTSPVTISVTQQAIIGVFLYYYVLIAIIALIAIIIAVGIGVFIYRQRVRRNNPLLTSANLPAYNNIQHYQNFMPLFAAEQLGTSRSICPICLQQIEAAEVVRQTPCKHVFHSTCIDSWGLKNLSCPVCRADLSILGIAEAGRFRNSSIHMEGLPMDQEWDEELGVSKQKTVIKAEGEPTPPAALLGSQKYQIRENML